LSEPAPDHSSSHNRVIQSNLEDSLFGAEGTSKGHIVVPEGSESVPEASERPFLGVTTRSTSPYRDITVPLSEWGPVAGYTGSAIISFEDFIKVNFFETNEAVAKLGLTVNVHGELKRYQQRLGAATARITYSIDWGDRSVGETVESPPDTVGSWSHPISKQVTMFPLNLFSFTRMRVRIYTSAYASTNNAQGQYAFAEADFGNTFTIEGLIPYDAAGNVLPANYLKYTTDSGFTYPVLGIPEPSTSLLLAVGIFFTGYSRRVRCGQCVDELALDEALTGAKRTQRKLASLRKHS